MIELQSLSKVYSGAKKTAVQAVNDVSMKVEDGEFLVITGRSGSGKTTLLNLIAGLARPSSGKVLLDDVDLWSLTDKKQSRLRYQKFGFIFQFPSLLPALTTLENVVLPLTFAIEPPEDGQERAIALLEEVGLADKIHSQPRQLSAGQQQRVVIARALLNNPEVLVADEPTSDLDEQTESEIMELFASIHKSTGKSIILVTHASQLVHYGSRWVEMASGKIKDHSV